METHFLNHLFGWRFLLQRPNIFQTNFFFRCVRERCDHCLSLAGAIITSETVSRSGTATTSATGEKSVGVPRRPVKLVGEPTGYTAGELVVSPEVCNHEFPLVMLPVMQATGWWIVLTWRMAPLDVDLHVFCGFQINPFSRGDGLCRLRLRRWVESRSRHNTMLGGCPMFHTGIGQRQLPSTPV